MRPIQYPQTQMRQVDGISTASIREFRGLNTFDPLSIPEGFWTDVVNLSSKDYPAATVRPGFTQVGAKIGTRCVGLAVHADERLVAAFNDGTVRYWTGSAWSAPIITITSSDPSSLNKPWSFTNYQGNYNKVNLMCTNGGSLLRFDGSQSHVIAGAPAGANFVTTYQNRLWVALGNEIRACKLDDAESWNSFPGTEEDSFGKTIESNHGENINMLSGSLTKLTIGFPSSVRELYGGLPSDFNDRLVTDDAGFVSNQAAVTQNSMMRFLHGSGIYEYAGGAVPSKEWSEIVSGYPLALNADSVAGSDGDALYFQAGDKTLVYDTRASVAAWNVWQGINATCFVKFKGDYYFGDDTGRVLKFGGTTDAGAPINWRATLKPFNNSSLAQKTRWYKLWVAVELAAGSSLRVYMSKSVNGEDWELVQSATGAGLGISRVLVPVGKYALENWVRIKLEGTGWARLHEVSRQTRAMPLQ